MFQKENRKCTARGGLTAALLALMVLTNTGCGGSGYYPSAGGGYYGGSPRTMGSSSVPPGYHYSDPSFCNGSGGGICPLLLGAAVVGIAAIAAH